MASDLFMNVIGWIGTGFALFFFIIPITLLYGLIKGTKPLSHIPWMLLMANISNCAIWSAYGYVQFDDKTQVWVCNSAGTLVNVVYLCIFCVYFAKKNVFQSIIYIILVIVVTGGLFFVFYEYTSIEVSGKVAMVFNILMFAAPSQKIVSNS